MLWILKCYRIIRYINKFNKAQQLGYFKDVSGREFEESDVENIKIILSEIDNYKGLYCDPYTNEFYEKVYNSCVEMVKPGFKEFSECFCEFCDKINDYGDIYYDNYIDY